jgi:hypothetical protein
MRNTTFSGLVVALLTACAMDATTGAGGGDDSIGGKADDASEGTATIVFSEGYGEELTGTIEAGAPLRVVYDADRLPGCRGEMYGNPAWAVTASWFVDDGSPVDVLLSANTDGLFEAIIDVVPAGADLALYFQVTNRWGCQEFDSDYGANYHFPIGGSVPTEQTLISFDADGTVSASGPVVAGATVRIHYEPSRVEECRGTTYGNPAWGVYGFAAVDGGEAQSFEVTRVEGSDRVPEDAEVFVRSGRELAIWFQFSNRWSL